MIDIYIMLVVVFLFLVFIGYQMYQMCNEVEMYFNDKLND
jgi:hypothetical protein